MPKGSGGSVCTSPGQVKSALRDDPGFRYEVVALDTKEQTLSLKMALADFDSPAFRANIDALFKASTSGQVAVQYGGKS